MLHEDSDATALTDIASAAVLVMNVDPEIVSVGRSPSVENSTDAVPVVVCPNQFVNVSWNVYVALVRNELSIRYVPERPEVSKYCEIFDCKESTATPSEAVT